MALLTKISVLRQMLEEMGTVEPLNPTEAGRMLQAVMLLRERLASLVEIIKLVLTAQQPVPDLYSAVSEEVMKGWLMNRDEALTEAAMLLAEIRVLDKAILMMKEDLWQDLASHPLEA